MMWNHYENHDERTNNRVEGDNNRMKQFCGAAEPKIDKCVALLRQYETTIKDKYNNAKKESARAPAQAVDVATRDTKFRQARRFHREGIISLSDYFKQIVNLYRFEPKKKYVEELENTDESDATSISDMSDEEDNEEDAEINNDAPTEHQQDNELPLSSLPPSSLPPSSLPPSVVDINEEFLNEIEDPDTIAYRLHAMQPRRRNEEIHQETNELTSLITELNKSNLAETSQNNDEHLIQQNQPVTQQAQLSEVSSVNCLFCGKHFAKKGKWLTKHQDSCSQNPDSQN
jgi:hypothetical protein